MSFVTAAYCQTDSLVTSDTVAAEQQDTSDAAFQLWIKEIFDEIFEAEAHKKTGFISLIEFYLLFLHDFLTKVQL